MSVGGVRACPLRCIGRVGVPKLSWIEDWCACVCASRRTCLQVVALAKVKEAFVASVYALDHHVEAVQSLCVDDASIDVEAVGRPSLHEVVRKSDCPLVAEKGLGWGR